MRNDLKLYIGGQEVDLGSSTNILFNYRQKDLTNPTVVKNSFSKTIELEKTDNNNQIFGHIWNLNRVQGTSFNPSKRVDFVLMLNGELLETGYCKLDKVNERYSITLYGGLGDFFYNLMYDTVTGEKKNLASLDYGMDLGFTINKDTVYYAWNELSDPIDDEGKKWETINFAPCYNGLSDTIDNDKVLVNTSGVTAGMRLWKDGVWNDINGFPTTVDNDYYLYNGYGFTELPKEMNEWQTRDLRSYLQRPVIRMRSIIEACCNPVNNGGFEVELDNEFFNTDNPYWKYAWLTLPMLNDLGGEITEGDFSATVANVTTLNGWYNTTYNLQIPSLPSADSYSISFKFRVTGSTDLGNTAKTSGIVNGKTDYGGYAVHVAGFDSNGNSVSEGDTVWMTSSVKNESDYLNFSDTNAYGINGGDVYTQVGDFNKISNGVYEWPQEITLKLPSNGTRISRLKVTLLALANVEYLDNSIYTYGTRRGKLYGNSTSAMYRFDRNQTLTDLSGKYFASEGTPINSNSVISQSNLLATENTPADYLIGYCKLFNLYFEKDPFEKKIYIRTQRHFYDGEAVNIEEKIDRKNIDIKPISFETKWYEFNYKDTESENALKYLDNYGTQFGKQKVNTGYDFNAEAKQLMDTPFKNGVQVLETGKYYAVGQTDFWNEIPTFLFNSVTYKLFNSELDATEMTISQPRSLTIGLINKNSTSSVRYDAFPKVQFHNGTDTVDGKDVLLFFNGFGTIRSDGYYQPKYMITDDLQEMLTLNDNKPCWLYTKTETDVNGNKIAWEIKRLPQFSRYTTVESTDDVYYSWDFGRTKELYVPAYKYTSADSTIYERYWKRYIQDLYDVNTRIVECYVKFDEKIMLENLKHYYYFDNSYWVINEIIDYNPAVYDTVKVRFVKVNDLQAYTDYNPAITPDGTIQITLYNPNIGQTGGTVEGYVYVPDGGSWSFSAWDNGLTPSITGGTGSQHFTLTVAYNPLEEVRGLHITAQRGNYTDTAIVVQEAGGTEFKVSPMELVFFNTGGTLELTITDPIGHRWGIVGKEGWTSCDIMSGTSSAIIQVTAAANTTGIDRSGSTVVYDFTDNRTYIVHTRQTDNQGDSEHLKVTQFAQYSNTNVPQTGGTCLYNVRSTSPWTVTCDRTYCIPLASGGTGNTLYGQTLEVNWPDNTSYSYRNAILTFRNAEGYEVKMSKNQDGINLTNLNFDQEGETKSVEYESDAEVVTKPDWINVTTDGEGTYYLEASENETGGERESEVILKNGDGSEFTIKVTQEAGDGCCGLITKFRVVPTELYYDGNGGQQYFFINNPDNEDWQLTGFTWGTPNINHGRTSAIVAFNVPATVSARTEYITVLNLTDSGNTKLVYVEQGSGATRTITVNPQTINSSASGGTYTVTITVPNHSDNDIITVNGSSGITVGSIVFTGDTANVTITVPENNTESGKTHTVTFTLNGNVSTTLTINQEANTFYLTVTPDVINVDASGMTTTIIIDTNDPSGFIIE